MTIEAMKQALEALERGRPQIVGALVQQDQDNAITAIKQALEQPEPEPVAWMHKHIDDTVIAHRPADLDRHPERWMALYAEPKSCQTCEALARTVMLDQTSHDTPPKREWQGLTDEEIDRGLLRSDYALQSAHAWRAGVVFAMTQLKEKNND